ncbi:MAG: MBL fold metallo-hydrolase [Candidatus Methylomirabilales bacterium]
MASAFLPRLVNGPWGDPTLYLRLRFERRALLFDLGDLTRLPPADLLKVSAAFVSHTHIDHFIGFDHLLRIILGRHRALALYGPAGFLDNLEGRLRAYTWNLVEGLPLVLTAVEVRPQGLTTATFPCSEGFRRVPGPAAQHSEDGCLVRDPALTVQATVLDHRIPCLAFACAEPIHLNVDTVALDRLGLVPGPWITLLKRLIREGAPVETEIPLPAGAGRKVPRRLGPLRAALLREAPGERLVYVTDVAYTPANAGKVIALARGADLFYCEAAYLDRDRDLAAERYHLTAAQAGALARQAAVKRLVLFHFSARYEREAKPLWHEAREAFGGPVTVPGMWAEGK